MAQQGDVKLVQTNNDGDIDVVNGVVAMSGGLETAAYLSLFGGNEDDDGRDQNSHSWWGNNGEATENQYHSKTQYLLDKLPATTGNLLRIQDAVATDLAWLTSAKIASSITITVSIPAVNSVNINIIIEADGLESEFNFTENWKVA